MLRTLLGTGDFTTKMLMLLAYVVAILISLPFHEFAHAFISDKLGDNTARYKGRLTLNPFAHLDLIGTLMLFFVGVGYAKPVPINPLKFKNRKQGMALTALAGPVSNLILAIVFLIIGKLMFYTGLFTGALYGLYYIIQELIIINIALAVFNMLPIPPLDGSRIVTLFLSERTYFNIMQYERYIMLGMFVVLMTGVLDVPLNFLNNFLYGVVNFLTGFVEIIFGRGWPGIF